MMVNVEPAIKNGQARRPIQRRLKRVLDVCAATTILLVMAPVMAVTAIAVRVAMGRPILFRQLRPGLDEQVIRIAKFRTMLPEVDARGEPILAANRVTRLGWFLRRTSLDELPQLWSVVRGDLSLVGPRPLLVDYLSVYTERERVRHSVRPGITGLAQSKGRNKVGWDERLRLDVEYVETWSLWLDFKILANTAWMVIRPTDVARDPDQEGSLHSIRTPNGQQIGAKRWTGAGVSVVVFEGGQVTVKPRVQLADDQ
jgi:lipopolysaccharide/colanic/teichoic acid biosynthesis glycosyltransferase